MSASSRVEQRDTPVVPVSAPLARIIAPDGSDCLTDRPVTLIGGRRNADLSLSGGDVSKLHCALVNTGKAIIVCDLRSRTGTFVNEEVALTATLRPGDRLRVGDIALKVEFEDPPLAAAGGVSSRQVDLLVDGRPATLPMPVAIVGRRENCDLAIDHPDVSLAHALVFELGETVCLFDLGSRSGTFLNGDHVGLVQLQEGDELAIGNVKIRVRSLGRREKRAAAGSDDSGHGRARRNVEPALAAEPAFGAKAAGWLAAAAELGMPDLEQTIAALYAGLGAARAKLDQQREQLAERETTLALQLADVQRAREGIALSDGDLQRRAASLAEREEGIFARQRELDDRDRNLHARSLVITENENAVRAQRTDLERAAEAVRVERDGLAAMKTQVGAMRNELDAKTAAVAAREAILAAQEATLEARQRQVEELMRAATERERRVAEREAAEAEMFKTISQFKLALRDASASLGGMSASSAFAFLSAPMPESPSS